MGHKLSKPAGGVNLDRAREGGWACRSLPQYTGIATRSPPFMADSWAHSPTIVQLALVGASGRAGLSPRMAISQLCARWGWLPPWPDPWMNDSEVGSTMARVNFWIGSGNRWA